MDRQCLCEIRMKHDPTSYWSRCTRTQVQDSPFCPVCLDRHIAEQYMEVRTVVPQVK